MTRKIDYKKLTKEDRQYLQDRPWLRQPDGKPIEAPDEPVVAEEPESAPVEQTEGEATEADGQTAIVEESPEAEGATADGESEDDVIMVDYSEMKVAELKELCRSRGLPVSGTHDELVERLQADDVTEE